MNSVVLVSSFLLAGALSAQGFRFDSANSVALDGEIAELVLRTDKTDVESVKEEIYNQLMYLTGALNQYDSCGDLSNTELKLVKTSESDSNGYHEITYSAKFLVAWSKNYPVPAEVLTALPSQTDAYGQKSFFNSYGKACAPVADHGAADLEPTFFFYYRPGLETCPLLKSKEKPAYTSFAKIALKPSSKQTENKYPEYDKVWEDGRLTFTAVYVSDKPGTTDPEDRGVKAFTDMYEYLIEYFGEPESCSIEGKPGVSTPDIEMEWKLEDGRKVNVNLLLSTVESPFEADESFFVRYAERTTNSDVVTYNGHSRFGENTCALAQAGRFEEGQWQLYFLNGCSTFSDLHKCLDEAHQAANPESQPYEFLDIVSNAISCYFEDLAFSNMVIVDSMVGQERNYRQMLNEMPDYQHSSVIGEENNKYEPKKP